MRKDIFIHSFLFRQSFQEYRCASNMSLKKRKVTLTNIFYLGAVQGVHSNPQVHLSHLILQILHSFLSELSYLKMNYKEREYICLSQRKNDE